MTHQQTLFHDSIYDALAADVAAIGGVKKAASLLWPNNSDAAGRMRACLSADHPQKFDPEEILAIKRLARDANSAATLSYEAQQLGFAVQWLSPEDEQQRLQREFVNAVDQLTRLQQQMQRNTDRLGGVK